MAESKAHFSRGSATSFNRRRLREEIPIALAVLLLFALGCKSRVQNAGPASHPKGGNESREVVAQPGDNPGNSASKNINELLPRERQDLIIGLAERLERNPGIEAYLLPGDKLEADGSRLILLVSNPAMEKVYGGVPPEGVTVMELAGDPKNGPGASALDQALLKAGFQKGYHADCIYMLNLEFGIYGRDLIIGLANQIKSGRR